MMAKYESPTEDDRRRLEVLHEALENAEFSCNCGEKENCSYCNYEIDSDDIQVYHTDYDSLELRVRLTDLDTQSEIARRYNLSDDFADVVDFLREQYEDSEETEKNAFLSKTIQASKLLSAEQQRDCSC